MINFSDSVVSRPKKWKANEKVSAKKLNTTVSAVNRILVENARSASESIVSQKSQAPILYVCTKKSTSEEGADDNRMVGAKLVLRNGKPIDTERVYETLLNQDIGVGEYVIPVRQIDNKLVWASTGIGIVAENAEDFLYEDEHTELALTDEGWDRYDPPEDSSAEEGEIGVKQGLKITQSVGIAYYHDGDKKIYNYVRDYTYDSSGKLAEVSVERRIEVEVPTDCTA